MMGTPKPDKERARYLVALAQRLYAGKEYERAASCCAEAAEADPSNLDAHMLRAGSLERLGRAGEAAAAMSDADNVAVSTMFAMGRHEEVLELCGKIDRDGRADHRVLNAGGMALT